jgi:dihydroflavonol-4-reductase
VTTAVTGATGHVGANLVRALLDDGRSVRAVNRQRGASLAGLDVEFVAADVVDRAALRRAFEGVDVVYHLAAHISVVGDPHGLVRATNVDGVRNAAEAALDVGVRRFVHCSSILAFDLEQPGVIDETSPRAVAAHLPAYDRSKARGEVELRRVIDRGLDAVVINLTGVIGPYDFTPSRMGAVFLALARRRLPALVSGGFDWVDSRDAAAGMLAAEARGRTGENYLLGGHRRSVAALASLASSATGVRAPRLVTPMWLARAAAPAGLWWARWRGTEPLFTPESLHALETDPTVSTAKARRELGYEPRPTEATVADVHAWFREAGMLPGSGMLPG